jgi:hypothetical protein
VVCAVPAPDSPSQPVERAPTDFKPTRDPDLGIPISALPVPNKLALGILSRNGNDAVVEAGDIELVLGERVEEGRRGRRGERAELKDGHAEKRGGRRLREGEQRC